MKCFLASAQHKNNCYRCSDSNGTRNFGLTTNSSNFLRPKDNSFNETNNSIISDRSFNSKETTIGLFKSNETNKNVLHSPSPFFRSLSTTPLPKNNVTFNINLPNYINENIRSNSFENEIFLSNLKTSTTDSSSFSQLSERSSIYGKEDVIKSVNNFNNSENIEEILKNGNVTNDNKLIKEQLNNKLSTKKFAKKSISLNLPCNLTEYQSYQL